MAGDGKAARARLPICRKCIYYYITHDPANPFGCRGLGFKSKKNPALVVFESSGMQCQLFTAKKSSPPSRDDGSIVA